MMATATGKRKMIRMEKKKRAHIYTAQLHRKKKKLGIGSREKEKKKRMCVICFLLYNALGFGKEDEERSEVKKNREEKDTTMNSNALLRVQFCNLRSNN